MDNDKKLLDETFVKVIEVIPNMEHGSKEQATAVENAERLYKLKLEQQKFEAQEHESYTKLVAQEEDRKLLEHDRKFNRGLAVVTGVVVPVSCFIAGLNFEKTGTICSGIFKPIINCIVKIKK